MKTPVTMEEVGTEEGINEYHILDADGKHFATLADPQTAAKLIKIINAHEKLVEAINSVLSDCPDKDPGSYIDPEGGYRSYGNYGDVAHDAVNEDRWRIKVILSNALELIK